MSAAVKSIDLKKSLKKQDLGSYLQGREQPQSISLEEAVIGGCLMDGGAYHLVSFLNYSDFFKPEHQEIYKVICKLVENAMSTERVDSSPIDILTVTEALRKSGKLELVGGAYQLVELTSRVASAANIEYHARIIKQKSVQRQVIDKATRFMKMAYKDNTDVFELLDYVNTEVDTIDFTDFAALEEQSLNKAQRIANNKPVRKRYLDSMILTEQTVAWFGASGVGKTIMLMQFMEALAQGQGIVIPHVEPAAAGVLRNDAGQVRCLFVDFEMNEYEIQSRSTKFDANDQIIAQHEFSENIIRMRLKSRQKKGSRIDMVFRDIKRKIKQDKTIKIVVIDNATALSGGENLGDSVVANSITNHMNDLRDRYQVTPILVCHVPKINPQEKITMDSARGSKSLVDLCDAVIGMNHVYGRGDEGMIYMKQCKARGGAVMYDEKNVVQLQRQSAGVAGEYLCYKFVQFTDEDECVGSFLDKEVQDDLLEAAITERVENGTSWKKIALQIGWRGTSENLRQKSVALVETGTTQYELQIEGGKKNFIKKPDDLPFGEDAPSMRPTPDTDLPPNTTF